MSAETTVYTLPSCVQCDSTKRMLDRQNTPYNVVDLSQDEEAMNMVRSLGYTAAPVVISGDKHWSGFKMDNILSLAS